MRNSRIWIGMIAATMLAGTTPLAQACSPSFSAAHDREIALLDHALSTFRLKSAQRAKAKRLREESEALYKEMGKAYGAAQRRHAALYAVGYTESREPPKTMSHARCGGSTIVWVAPPGES